MAHGLEAAEAGSLNAGAATTSGQQTGLDYLIEGRNQNYSKPDTAQTLLAQVEITGLTSTNNDPLSNSDIRTLGNIAALNAIANNPELRSKLFDAEGKLSKANLESALSIEGALTSPPKKNQTQPDEFLGSVGAQAAAHIYKNWDELAVQGLNVTSIEKYSSQSLQEAGASELARQLQEQGEAILAGATAGAAPLANGLGKSILEEVVKAGLKNVGSAAGTSSEEKPPSENTNNAGYSNRQGTLPSAELKEAADAVFSRVDKNNDGWLSKEELAKAVQDKSFKGQEAQAIASMYRNVEMLQGLVKDEWGFWDNDGITRNDLAKFDSLDADRQSRLGALSDAARWADDRLQIFDKDGNKKLSMDEITTALQDQNLSQQDRQMLTYLKDNMGRVAGEHNDGEWFWQTKEVGKQDIKDHLHQILQANDAAKTVGHASWILGRTEESQRSDVSRNLFADKNDPKRSVTPDAIRQGTAGDCYFLAALAAVAQSNPQAVVNMIKDNGNGTYTVTFPGDPKHPVTVNAPTDAELGLYNKGHSTGTWATVLEKAYGKYLNDHQNRRGLTDVEGADGGGHTTDALKTLTGGNYEYTELSKMSKEDLAKALEANFAAKPPRPLTASTPPSDKSHTTQDGFAKSHAYTIVGFRPDGKGGGTVIIRNPWGHGQGTGGVSEISLEQFQKNFIRIARQK